MEGVFLKALGESCARHKTRPPLDLAAIDNRASFLQASSIELSTKRGYQTGAKDYITFCVNHHLPINPTPLTLSRYIAYTSQFIASAPKYLSGARHFLQEVYPDFDENRKHPTVQSTIRGSKKVRADPVTRKLPLRISHLAAFLQHAVSTTSYDTLLFATILVCAFFGCHRMGELVLTTKAQMDWRKVIKCSSLTFFDNRAQYHLPYHKTDPFYRGTDILFSKHDIVNPVDLLREYASIRDSLHGPRPPLFIRADGSIPTRSWFSSIFFTFLSQDYGGHSARAGGATYYASLGLSESVIQAIGRWSSAAWKIYIRDNPTIRAEQQLASIRLHGHLPPPPA
jgi:hypothetical protein